MFPYVDVVVIGLYQRSCCLIICKEWRGTRHLLWDRVVRAEWSAAVSSHSHQELLIWVQLWTNGMMTVVIIIIIITFIECRIESYIGAEEWLKWVRWGGECRLWVFFPSLLSCLLFLFCLLPSLSCQSPFLSPSPDSGYGSQECSNFLQYGLSQSPCWQWLCCLLCVKLWSRCRQNWTSPT